MTPAPRWTAGAVGPVTVDAALVAIALLDATLSAGSEGGAALGTSVLAALALAVRRRRPYAAFALTLPALFIGYVLIAPIVALYTLAATSRDRRPVLACAVLAGLGDFVSPLSDFHWHSKFDDLLYLIYAGVFAGAPVALGLLVQARQDLRDRLTELTTGHDREQRLLADRVLAQERARLAREMHDVVSHQVSLIAVQAGALRVTTGEDAARDAARTIRELAVATLTELRHMVGVLRTSGCSAPDLAPQPRLGDIPTLVAGSGHQARVDLDDAAAGAWPNAVQRAAYRTVQEALTNITKHAPGARVTVQVTPWQRGLRVAVRNGPAPSQPISGLPDGGHGLIGLRERAELLGGTLRTEPTPDGGYLVEVTFPGTFHASLPATNDDDERPSRGGKA